MWAVDAVRTYLLIIPSNIFRYSVFYIISCSSSYSCYSFRRFGSACATVNRPRERNMGAPGSRISTAVNVPLTSEHAEPSAWKIWREWWKRQLRRLSGENTEYRKRQPCKPSPPTQPFPPRNTTTTWGTDMQAGGACDGFYNDRMRRSVCYRKTAIRSVRNE